METLLMKTMGPFRTKLKSTRLMESHDGSIVVAENDGGLPLEPWGSSCGNLPEILYKVQRKMKIA